MAPKRQLHLLVFLLGLSLGVFVLLEKSQASFSLNSVVRRTQLFNERTTGSTAANNTRKCYAKDITCTTNVTPASIGCDVDISRWCQRRHSLRGESRKFIFLKTHKTGGSTVRNINLRFAISRGLDVMLSKSKMPFQGFAMASSWVHPSNLIPPKNKKYDILTDHLVFNISFLNRMFPPHVPKFTMLREPMEQAISGLRYKTITWPTPILKKGFTKHSKDPINAFLRNPYDFCTFYEPGFVNNRQSWQLGFKLGTDKRKLDKMKKNQTLLNAFAKRLDSHFDLVMITERFDESMLLLRRLLNWSMKEILYLKIKVHKPSEIWSKKPIIDDNIKTTFREFAAIDYALYDYFKPKFDKIVKSEPLIEEELKSYRNVLEQLKTYCASKSKEDLIIPPSRWTGHGFNIAPEDCHLMADEVHTESLVKRKQMERHKLKLSY